MPINHVDTHIRSIHLVRCFEHCTNIIIVMWLWLRFFIYFNTKPILFDLIAKECLHHYNVNSGNYLVGKSNVIWHQNPSGLHSGMFDNSYRKIRCYLSARLQNQSLNSDCIGHHCECGSSKRNLIRYYLWVYLRYTEVTLICLPLLGNCVCVDTTRRQCEMRSVKRDNPEWI